MKMTYEALRIIGTELRFHSNGFIQLNLLGDGEVRLHVWPEPDSGLQKQKTDHPIHDHVFAMHSRVVYGKLTNVTYEFENVGVRNQDDDCQSLDPLHSIHGLMEEYEAEYTNKHNSTLQRTGWLGYLNTTNVSRMTPGCEYEMPYKVFHNSIAKELTATVMTKTEQLVSHKPRVLCPWGVTPDNSFNRYDAPKEVMWAQIKKVFDAITYIEFDEGGLAT